MKALLVTSQVTYVPGNYIDLFDELCTRVPEKIAGVVFLQNLSLKVMRDALGLMALGCRGVSLSLIRNILELPLARREKLFKARGIPILKASSMNDPTMIEHVKAQGIDLVINLRTRCIYRSEILSAPKLGCINIHHGLLPEYRGTLCDLYALHEKRPAGFTIHVMNEKIDAGRILLRQAVSQGEDTNYVRYLARTGKEEGIALARLLNESERSGKLPDGVPNRTERVVYTRNPTRAQIRAMRQTGMVL